MYFLEEEVSTIHDSESESNIIDVIVPENVNDINYSTQSSSEMLGDVIIDYAKKFIGSKYVKPYITAKGIDTNASPYYVNVNKNYKNSFNSSINVVNDYEYIRLEIEYDNYVEQQIILRVFNERICNVGLINILALTYGSKLLEEPYHLFRNTIGSIGYWSFILRNNKNVIDEFSQIPKGALLIQDFVDDLINIEGHVAVVSKKSTINDLYIIHAYENIGVIEEHYYSSNAYNTNRFTHWVKVDNWIILEYVY